MFMKYWAFSFSGFRGYNYEMFEHLVSLGIANLHFYLGAISLVGNS